MDKTLKSDIVQLAYSMINVSGLTSPPTARELSTGLDRLESLMHEYEADGATGYNFEELPNLGSLHNLKNSLFLPVSTVLAYKLSHDLRRPISPILKGDVDSSNSFIVSQTIQVRNVQRPSRFPRGSGNEFRYWGFHRRFNIPVAEVPLDPESKYMVIGDIQDFEESYESYLADGETINSYDMSADSGLDIVESSNDSPIINYRVQATGKTSIGGAGMYRLRIVITTSDDRILTRDIYFDFSQGEENLTTVVETGSGETGVAYAERASMVDGTAFYDQDGTPVATEENLNGLLVLIDGAGKQAQGFIKSIGTGETYDSEIILNGDFTDWTGSIPDDWGVNLRGGNTISESPAGVMFINAPAAGSNCYAASSENMVLDGLHKCEVDILTILQGGVRYNLGESVYTDFTSTGFKTIKGTATNAAWTEVGKHDTLASVAYIDDVSVKQILTPSVNGVVIVSTMGGSTENWQSIDVDFDPNDIVTVIVAS